MKHQDHKCPKCGGWFNEMRECDACSGVMYSVKEADIRAARDAISNGIEYLSMMLKDHDSQFGRKTIKNKAWAETMERDLMQMRTAINALPNYS